MSNLYELSKRIYSQEPGTKHPSYYRKYDQVFSCKDFVPTSILEIGVHLGESTKVFASTYPNAKIVGVDLNVANIDFSDFPNVTYLQADQSDRNALTSIIQEHLPQGIDLAIDDASHIGSLSRITFDTVFPHINNKGLYIIEDWGTGYWDTFSDGSRFQEYPLNFHDGNLPKRLPSHDFGMVGFVKSLVDLTGEEDIRLTETAPRTHRHRIETLEFCAGICIAEKAAP